MSVAGGVGKHMLADLHGVEPSKLRDEAALAALLRRAAVVAGARVLACHFHHFGHGNGVTGVVLLAESHMSVHTWPELELAAVDIFMCGEAAPERALAVLVAELNPRHQHVQSMARGAARAPVCP